MSRITIYDQFRAEKYSADDMKDLLDKGKAMKNANGDPSYPVADREDIEKAVQAVGRGSADHDAIRLHIINGAKAINAMDLIPDNWNLTDGSLKDADEAKKAPLTAVERREASLSFGDIQSRLYSAIVAALPFGCGDDIWVQDCGPDWVVWEDWEKGQCWQVHYSIDGDGNVTFTDQPVLVARQTSFVPVQQNSAGEHGHEHRGEQMCCDGHTAEDHRAFSSDHRCCTDSPPTEDPVRVPEQVPENKSQRAEGDCKLCGGTGKIREGNVTCPDCNGTGKTAETKSAKLSGRRRRPLTHQRRSLERLPEFRRMTTAFERRVQQDGDDIVLEGMPIRYATWYGVRDIVGPFEERMNPGVATKAMQSQEFDCRFLLNHEGMPMARSVSGTLTFEDTRAGLKTYPRIDARQQIAYDLAVGVERGDITQMSVGFMVADGGDEWRLRTDGTEERDVYEFAELFDVSAVTYPASPTTSIELAQRMMAQAGAESRARIMRLFEIGGAVRSGRGLTQKDGDALRAAAEALYEIEKVGVPVSVRLDAYTKATETLFGALRAGKVLSSDNESDVQEALDALHSADDIDIPGITRSLETIDKALDVGQAALARVLGRANPDGDPADLEPTLAPPADGQRSLQRAQLELIRTRELIAS